MQQQQQGEQQGQEQDSSSTSRPNEVAVEAGNHPPPIQQADEGNENGRLRLSEEEGVEQGEGRSGAQPVQNSNPASITNSASGASTRDGGDHVYSHRRRVAASPAASVASSTASSLAEERRALYLQQMENNM